MAGLAIAAGCGSSTTDVTGPVHVWMTTPDLSHRLTPEPDVLPDLDTPATITFDTGRPFQAIDGFGAAFTDTSGFLLWSGLDQASRARVMSDLFARPDGIGLSFMRVPMAASDFTACGCSYSYDDAAGGDPTQSSFTTAHDDAAIIPVIRAAMVINPQLRLVANPWSPPAWMKTNGSMLGTAGGQLGALRQDAAQPLAQYFAAFLSAYRAKGVPIWAITPQNEPAIAPDTYPGMLFPAQDEAAFIANQLAPTLAAAGLGDVEILGGDDVGAERDYAQTLWSSPAAPSLYGTAWHCYGGLDEMTAIHQDHPDKPVYVTECSTGPTGIAGEATPQVMAATRNWASGVLLWNLALDPNGGPKQGHGCDGCTGLITVDPATGTATPTINYYELGQFSKFVAPGAHRVASTDGGGVSAQAYLNPDGTAALVAYNTNAVDTAVAVRWRSGGAFTFTLPAGATVTFTD